MVSSGTAGTEPYYTNRCGLAADWCITAPGGGDDQARNGVFAARSGGGYIRKSGTSMAAPHISAGLAVILDAFPTLSPQAAARRMLATASHDGLVAAGYLTYSLSADALLAAFMLLNVGERYVPAELFDQEEQTGLNQDGWLTGRERDVLNGLLSGKSNKEIALAYGLSEVTIKHHLKNLRSKLGARNRTHAVCRAIELGLADEYSVSA